MNVGGKDTRKVRKLTEYWLPTFRQNSWLGPAIHCKNHDDITTATGVCTGITYADKYIGWGRTKSICNREYGKHVKSLWQRHHDNLTRRTCWTTCSRNWSYVSLKDEYIFSGGKRRKEGRQLEQLVVQQSLGHNWSQFWACFYQRDTFPALSPCVCKSKMWQAVLDLREIINFSS